MADLILELYSEELPLAAQTAAEVGYKLALRLAFEKTYISFNSLQVFCGPCRITIYATGLPTHVNKSAQVIKGPRISASKESVEGFCRKHSIDFDSLALHEGYYFYHKPSFQEECRIILAQILPEILSAYTWNNTMRWGEHNCLWPRPLKNIMCIFDDKVLPFSYHHLEVNEFTFGHKFLTQKDSDKGIKVSNWLEYTLALEKNSVVLKSDDRVLMIKEQALKLLNANLLADVLCPDLLIDIAGTVEMPFVMMGKIPTEYMALPAEVINTVMRVHQKYFATYDVKTKEIAPYFLFVSNCPANEAILSGNERVLKARLADAHFLYEKDLKIPVEIRYEQLSNLTFHASLGSVQKKSQRLESLSSALLPSDLEKEDLVLAARLCKCDLAGDVVSDLPSLQGYIGYHYAINAKYSANVALAIKEHYLPAGLKDNLPHTNLGLLLSLIDKVDSLTGMYVAGEIATGNKDPYGLRRLALGIIRIFSSGRVHRDVNLQNLLLESIKLYEVKEGKNLCEEIFAFIKMRHKHLLKCDFEATIVDAVIDFANYKVDDAYDHALQMQKFKNSEIYEFVLQTFKRIRNLLNANVHLLEGFLMQDISLEAITQKHKAQTNEEYSAGVLSALTEYDALTLKQDRIVKLVHLNLLCSALTVFVENVQIAGNPLRVLLLACALERFNSLASFDHLRT